MAEEEELNEENLAEGDDAAALEEAMAGGDDETDPSAEEMLEVMEEQGDAGEALGGEAVDHKMETEIVKAEEGGGTGSMTANIERLMDVPLTVTIELGRTRKTIETVMEYGDQSLIELDKTVGEPCDVLVNGELFARGEVVTVSEHFGVRITELVNPIPRAQ